MQIAPVTLVITHTYTYLRLRHGAGADNILSHKFKIGRIYIYA